MPTDRYMIDSRSWLRLAYAAKLIGTNVATVKKMMGAGTLDWCQPLEGSTTFLVHEEQVLALRSERHRPSKEAAKRRAAIGQTAHQRKRSQLAVPPRPRASDALVRTWDPSPTPPKISGRDDDKG